MRFWIIIKILAAVILGLSALSVLIIGLIYGFDQVLPIFIAFHLVAYVYVLAFLLVFVALVEVTWLLFTDRLKDRNPKARLRKIIFSVLLALMLCVWLANHFLYSYLWNFTSIAGNAAMGLVSLFLVLYLIDPKGYKKAAVWLSAGLFCGSLLLSAVNIEPQNPSLGAEGSALGTLPYAKWVDAQETAHLKGVVYHDREKAYEGLNLYSSVDSPRTFLIDMEGNVRHVWDPEVDPERDLRWPHVEMTDGGDLFLIAARKLLVRIDSSSQVIWKRDLQSHHDVDVADNGDVLSLLRRHESMIWGITPLPFGNDYIMVLSFDGSLKIKISLMKLFKDIIPRQKIQELRCWLLDPKPFLQRIEMAVLPPRDIFGKPTDLFHTNTLEILDKDMNEIFKKGHILISVRNMDLIAVVDITREKLVWHWGQGTLQKPHHPTLLDNGHILVFDNGNTRKYSRVIELDPQSLDIVWMYEAQPRDSFYTSWGGSNQRMPNGNTLIVDSGKGRAFEVTQEGDIVWDFYNPHMISEKKMRASIYRMERIWNPDRLSFLNSEK